MLNGWGAEIKVCFEKEKHGYIQTKFIFGPELIEV